MSISSSGDTQRIISIGIIVLMSLLLGWFTRRSGMRQERMLRPIPAFKVLRGLLGQAAESGKAVHLSLGTSGIGSEQMAVAASGLSVLRYLADQSASLGVSPLVTVADPTLMLVAQDVLYRAHKEKGTAEAFRPTAVEMIAPDATVYAAGAQDVINQEKIAANIMIGHLGEEYLLLGEAGAQRGIVQLAGSDTISAQPFMLSTARHVLIGEEVFAVGAYLTHQPAHLASLRVQDLLRVGIVIAILLGVLARTVGMTP